MAVAVHTDCRIYLGPYDVSADHNKVQLDDGATEVDTTVFTNTAGKVIPGQYKPKIAGSGFIQYGLGLVNDALKTQLGLANLPVTVSPIAGAAGDLAFLTLALEGSYSPINAKVGAALPFSFTANAQGVPLVAGNIFVPASPSLTVSGTSGVIQLGGVTTAQKLYAALHVLSVSGVSPTLAVTVKSAAAVGFASPTTRLTFTTKSSVVADFLSLAGALGTITDQFWRVDYTIGGTGSPTFGAVAAVGIF